MVRLRVDIYVAVARIIRIVVVGGCAGIVRKQRRFRNAVAGRAVVVLRYVRGEAVRCTYGSGTARVTRRHVELVHVEVPKLRYFTVLLVGGGDVDGLACSERIKHRDVVLHVICGGHALLDRLGGDACRGSCCEGRNEVRKVQIIGQRL